MTSRRLWAEAQALCQVREMIGLTRTMVHRVSSPADSNLPGGGRGVRRNIVRLRIEPAKARSWSDLKALELFDMTR